MRIGIFADSHDHLDHLRQAVEVFNRARCELVLFAGDLVSTFAVPPLRRLRCPVVACFGDNEGNKTGLHAGFGIIGDLGEPPLCVRCHDGTRIVLAHMRRQISALESEFDVAVYAHTHKPRIDLDARGRLWINPGETSGWTYGTPSVVLFESAHRTAEIYWLRERAGSTLSRSVRSRDTLSSTDPSMVIGQSP